MGGSTAGVSRSGNAIGTPFFPTLGRDQDEGFPEIFYGWRFTQQTIHIGGNFAFTRHLAPPASQEYDWSRWRASFHTAGEFPAIDLGHAKIGNHDVKGAAVQGSKKCLDPRFPSIGNNDFVSITLEDVA
jgi:hypothetical protein